MGLHTSPDSPKLDQQLGPDGAYRAEARLCGRGWRLRDSRSLKKASLQHD